MSRRCCQPVRCRVVCCESSSSSSSSCEERKKKCRKQRRRRCRSSSSSSSSSSEEERQNQFQVQNLVSNVPGRATNLDPNNVNSWGIVFNNNQLWVAENGTGIITTYTTAGVPIGPVITVPPAVIGQTGVPTGLVINPGPNFLISGLPATYLASTEDGLIVAYNASVNPTNAITVVNRSGVNAVYKGLAVTTTNIYAADFHNNRIDTFDTSFNLLGGFPFVDPGIPVGFAVFNIVYLGGNLYVSYAKQDSVAHDDVSGQGNGFVDIYTTAGIFIRRFVSQGYLNSPWGMISAQGINTFENAFIIVSNFGDGVLNVFNRNGNFLGRLNDCNGMNIIISGLWGITPNNLFFASGPNGEGNGLVGKLITC